MARPTAKASKFRTLTVPLLSGKFSVKVFLGDQDTGLKKIRKHFGNNTIEEVPSGYAGRTFNCPGYPPAILITISQRNKYFMGVLAHEAIHAVNYVWDDMGETHHDEVYAYSVESIINAVLGVE